MKCLKQTFEITNFKELYGVKSMNRSTQVLSLGVLTFVSTFATAKPMPNFIQVDDKAVVPVVKTQVIRRVEGQEPVRTVTATIFEVTNQGKDIVAREVELQDKEGAFSEKQMSIPVIKQGSVIVPTSKIELTTQIKQDGQVIGETKTVDAAGVEVQKNGEFVRRELQLEQITNPEAQEKVTHAVAKEGGVTTRDIVIFDETKATTENQ